MTSFVVFPNAAGSSMGKSWVLESRQCFSYTYVREVNVSICNKLLMHSAAIESSAIWLVSLIQREIKDTLFKVAEFSCPEVGFTIEW